MLSPKDFKGKMEDIERKVRETPDFSRAFSCLIEVAAVALEKERMKRQKGKASVADPPPDMPQEFQNCIRKMEGTEVKLIIQKPLFKTDLNRGEGRLSVPVNQVQCHDFLTDEEEESLNMLDERGKLKAIETKVIGPNVTEETANMNFKKWDMKKSNGSVSSSYVLTTKWNSLVASNPSTLKVGNVIQLWSFRQKGQLCFALVALGSPA